MQNYCQGKLGGNKVNILSLSTRFLNKNSRSFNFVLQPSRKGLTAVLCSSTRPYLQCNLLKGSDIKTVGTWKVAHLCLIMFSGNHTWATLFVKVIKYEINKIVGTPILKLAMIKDNRSKKNLQKNQNLSKKS